MTQAPPVIAPPIIRDGVPYKSMWTTLRGLPFEQGYVHAGSIRTRYVHVGTRGKPGLIMLHGTASQAETFCNNLAAHAEHFDCYAIDMLGTGYTDKPDQPYEIGGYAQHLRDFMDAVGLQRASLVGVSLGAWVAARFAIDYPDRLDRMTLLAPAGHVVDPVRMARIKASRQQAAETPSWASVQAVLERLVYDKKSLFDDIVASRYAFYCLPEMRQAMENILVLQDPVVRARNIIAAEDWGKITAPTLIIGGVNDNEGDLKEAQEIADLIPGSRLEVVDNIGHWGHFEVPETFNPLNISFLNGND